MSLGFRDHLHMYIQGGVAPGCGPAWCSAALLEGATTSPFLTTPYHTPPSRQKRPETRHPASCISQMPWAALACAPTCVVWAKFGSKFSHLCGMGQVWLLFSHLCGMGSQAGASWAVECSQAATAAGTCLACVQVAITSI